MMRRLIVLGGVIFFAALATALAPSSALAVELAAFGRDVVRLPAVEVSGLPRSYVTITIAIPEPLRGAAEVSFEVRLSGLTDLVGRTAGVLRPQESKRVILTLRVPSDALVGILDVADVVFISSEGDEYIVPILLRVPAVHAYNVTGAREFRGLRNGDRVELAYQVTNHGNAPDTLEYSVRTPMGWVVRPQGVRRLVIPARQQMEVPASLVVPATANLGDHEVELWVRSARDSVAVRQVTTVVGVAPSEARNGGFMLAPRIGMAATRGSSATFIGAELSGPIAEDVSLAVRYSQMTRSSGVAVGGLSAVGASGSPFGATLQGKSWQLQGGNVGGEIGTLTGINLSGQGVYGSLQDEQTRARVIAAQPTSGDRSAGSLLGASYGRQFSHGFAGLSASALQEPVGLGAGRELTALGADFTSRPIGTLVLGGALAFRSTPNGSGVGALAEVTHDRPGESASLMIAHAPGGSAGFARATDEIRLSGARDLTDRWGADASLSSTRDEGRNLQRSSSSNFALVNRYQLTEAGSVALRLLRSSFDVSSGNAGIGAFGQDQTTVGLMTNWNLGETDVGVELTEGTIGRSTELLDGRVVESTSGQGSARLDARRHFFGVGLVTGATSYQVTGAGVGIPSTVWTASGGWSSEAMLIFGRPTLLNSTLNYLKFGASRAALSVRAGLRTALPGGLDLAVSVERNPFFVDAQGRAGLGVAVGLSTSTRVLSAAMLGPDGVVFADLNRNGRRDADEPGVGGVAVRRGNDRVVSRRDGRYRLPAAARGRTRVDLSTIPAGLVAHPMLGVDNVELRDIPLLPTGDARVELKLIADDEGRVPDVDLSLAVVVLKDARGFEWLGRRREGSPLTTFEGIPTGRYSMRVDISALREAVRIEDGPQLEVTATGAEVIVVPVRGRVIRIIAPPGRGLGRAGRGDTPPSE